MPVLASAMLAAVASDKPRSTFTGDACRSAIAPKISGETNAATAVAAYANGLMSRSPCPSSTVLNGTNHMLIAAPCRKNSAINSAYSALRIVLSTRKEHTPPAETQAHTPAPWLAARPSLAGR